MRQTNARGLALRQAEARVVRYFLAIQNGFHFHADKSAVQTLSLKVITKCAAKDEC